ncbi:MAG: DUF2796 domain-containing protein [Helicobacteraceae bacterium]|jgi:hypothetical protein|nr:DUF2796 domain-containing protein [Helicobacteraceae bacterium]
MNRGSVLVLSAFSAAFFATNLFAAHAHEHGVAKMNVGIDGKEVTIELETPLANALSYEHKPQNAAQEKEAKDMAKTLRNAEKLFVFPSKSECKLQSVSLKSEALDETILGANPKAHEEHSDRHDDEEDDHDHEEHADLDAEFVFNCKNPKALTTIEIGLFKVFPNFDEIEAQIVTEKGQNAAELTPKSAVLKIAR